MRITVVGAGIPASALSTRLFFTWDFGLKRRRQDEQVIQGARHIWFAPDGRVVYHRDYWDAAEELYEELPVLGILMRWLRRQAAK